MNLNIKDKTSRRRAGILAAMLFTAITSQAQTFVSAPMTGTPAAGDYYNNTSITLTTGFSFTASGSQYLRLYILPPGCSPLGTVPTIGQNYVLTSVPRVPINSVAGLSGRGTCELMQTVQYFDGLGRPLQTVSVKGNPDATKDVIQSFEYDAYGRELTKYLPFTMTAATPGIYEPTALAGTSGYSNSAQYTFYQQTGLGYVNTQYPKAVTLPEASPLNRTYEQGAPGAAWQLSNSGVNGAGHSMKMDYGTNNQTAFVTTPVTNNPGSQKVALYKATINSNQTRTLTRAGNTAVYNSAQLYLTITKDENWKTGADSCLSTTEEYKNKEGKVVLKRTYNQKSTVLEMLSTYYVYDDTGNLSFVLPPNSAPDGTTAFTQTKLDALCYQYRYDNQGRMTQKKLPGKGWQYLVYNTIDKVVATQDSLQRAANQWVFTKYDNLGRVIITGTWNNGGTAITRASLQTTLDGTATLWENATTTGTGYTTVAWPTANTSPLTINYYDDYTGIPSFPTAYTAPTDATSNTQGLLTATKTAVLNTPADMLWTVHYYDNLGHNIKSYNQHYLGGVQSANNYEAIINTYDITGTVTTTKRQHYNTTHTTTPLVTIDNTYYYDHMGRKRSTWERITNGTTATTNTLVSKVDYNEVGQVKTKHLHSTDSITYLQNIAYAYNERGWLLSSSAPLFEELLQYNVVNTVTGISPVAQYNGNIASQSWGTAAAPNTMSYTYGYDRLNRLLSGTATDGNSENSIAYDQAGNITALKRYQASTLIDNFTYTYSSTNQLKKLRDTLATSAGMPLGTWNYTYDGNGNLKTDPSKGTTGITMAYNLLNLAQNITGGITITYTYDAVGNKLRRNSAVNGTTDYVSGIQYEGSITGLPAFIQTEEGRAIPNGTTAYNYQYTLSDHLGDARQIFETKTGAAVSIQKDDYYPYGMEINRSVLSPKNNYLYNKKELQEELGLYDYGARFYDPMVARWTTVDPLATKYQQLSPYNYVSDNPIMFIDPDGNKITIPDGADRTQVLKLINSLSENQYAVNEKTGELYMTAEKNKDGSAYYSSKLDAAIGNDNTIEIHKNAIMKDKLFPNITLLDKDVDKFAGGGITEDNFKLDVVKDKNGNEVTLKTVRVIISGNSYEGMKDSDGKIIPQSVLKDVDGKVYKDDAARILMHELVGHAIPIIVGKDTGNAVENENKVNKQLPKDKNQQRAAEPKHLE